MSLYATAALNPAGHRDVHPAAVTLPPVEVRIIDVREPHEFVGELGHVPGSTLVPLGALMAQAVGWPKDVEYLLVCRSGGRSAQASMALTRAGFGRVMNLVGGMLAWNQAGLSVER